jgi:O-antigen/teichoic acid export membrane protein
MFLLQFRIGVKEPCLQLRLWHIARSVLSNWFAMAAYLAVGFFLAPFIVHRLGNVAYGVWILAISAVNYFALLDLGMAGSLIRFISQGHTTQDHQASSEALGAVLWVRLQISALILALSGGLAAMFSLVFKVPPALVLDAREALLIVGVSVTVSISFGVFSATLSALNRYDLRSYATLTQLAVRVIGTVAVLLAGRGIVAMAFCELLATVVGSGMMLLFTRKTYPELRIRLTKPRWEVLRKIWSYSVYAFVIAIAIQLVYQTDNLVVGAFISASAVTFYSIGNSLCRYTQQLIGAMTATFTSAASTYQASGDTSNLRALYYNGTRATMALSLPILITLIFRGDNFIGVWMGPQYSRTSGTVLAILATALVFSLQNAPATSIAFGIEKHKTIAMWAIGEAIANLTLSIILARKIGIYGVAIGTLLPSLAVNLLLWPRYICHLVGIHYREVVLKVWGPVFLCAVPFAGASYAVDVRYPAHHMMLFILQTIALLPIFLLSIGVVFRNNFKRQVLPRIRSFFSADANQTV